MSSIPTPDKPRTAVHPSPARCEPSKSKVRRSSCPRPCDRIARRGSGGGLCWACWDRGDRRRRRDGRLAAASTQKAGRCRACCRRLLESPGGRRPGRGPQVQHGRRAAGDPFGAQRQAPARTAIGVLKGSFAPLGKFHSGSSPNSFTTRRSAGSRPRTRWERPPRRSTPCTPPRKTPRSRAFTRRWQSGDPNDSSTRPSSMARSSPSWRKGRLRPSSILPTYQDAGRVGQAAVAG